MILNLKSATGILAIGLVVFFASCKPKKDDSPKAKLIGKWKNTSMAIDANGNGMVDAGETYPIPDTVLQYYTFNSDGSGSISQTNNGMTYSVGYTWTMTNNTDIQIHPAATSSMSEQDFKIQTLTATDLTVKNTTSASGATYSYWLIFKKQ